MTFDACSWNTNDGDDEAWYYYDYSDIPTGYTLNIHYPHNITCIKYYFADTAYNDPNYTWTTDISLELANEIKAAFASSMEKWNNVVYYTYDSYGENGNRYSNDIITIEEGTAFDHNVTIYPIRYRNIDDNDPTNDVTAGATSFCDDIGTYIPTGNTHDKHYHTTQWGSNAYNSIVIRDNTITFIDIIKV